MKYFKLLVNRGTEEIPVDCREDKMDEILGRFGRDAVTMLDEDTGEYKPIVSPEPEPKQKPKKKKS